ncbi:MAG: glycerol-3-phosphate 1-O-acyltransferase PlsY [Bacillota bacterium]|nr:glycerol-3-phosphate 1-O-acyltransferase PlsY [Bacillota bacterium]
MIKLMVIIFAYFMGSIPTGIILGKSLKGIDIREHGSKNTGATNAYRVLGTKIGIMVLMVDILKGSIPVLVARVLGLTEIYFVIVGIVVILGHTFSVFLNFQGGKGVATSTGVFFVLIPKVMMILVILFIGIVYFSRYISLASIISAGMMPILVLAIYGSKQKIIFLFSVLIGSYVIYKHKTNIHRLINGNENLYQEKGISMENKINEIVKDKLEFNYLLLFATSKSVSAKDGNITSDIINGFGGENITTKYQIADEESKQFSFEKILEIDPKFIFVQTMGSVEKAKERLEKDIILNPAWSSLSAVKEGRFIYLPKELFLYKPNMKFVEAYEYMRELLEVIK